MWWLHEKYSKQESVDLNEMVQYLMKKKRNLLKECSFSNTAKKASS